MVSILNENYELQKRLDEAMARVSSLEEENAVLCKKLQQLTTDTDSGGSHFIEAKIKTFQLEQERDQLLENMENLKRRYAKLHEAYLEKLRRCKALEDTFQRQKTLTGLVLKSSMNSGARELLQVCSITPKKEEDLKARIEKLQVALDEAYDIIDEMDFELESIDLLEMQNQSLQKELLALKQSQRAEPEVLPKINPITEDRESVCDICSKSEHINNETLERTALTRSLVETAEIESNQLRRELLRSRLQNTIKQKQVSEYQAE